MKTYSLLAITDLDKDARNATSWTWRAVTRKGSLAIDQNGKSITVFWRNDSDEILTTHLNWKGHAMELSDLSRFNGRLLSPDDKTGMLYEIKDGEAIPWLFLNSGPGNTTCGMKAEWTTTMGKYLFVGSHGTESKRMNGNVVSEDPMWIKIVSKNGEVRSCKWKCIYKKLRRAVNITEQGYLTHEAVQWSPYHKKWFFLPRKESNTTYNNIQDEKKGTNLLIIGNPNLTQFEVVRIGKLNHSERGFSAFEFIPETNDTLIAALKSEEVGDQPPKSYITVFNIFGQVLLDDQKLDNQYKFEGIYFL
uniref:Apyrase n=1 Tax=Angiostrongylus cantonensis TaxID=6313 RepID=A0A0K0D2K1_ANGCA